MNERLNYFNHAGQKIMWCDYGKFSEEKMIALLEEAVVLGKAAGKNLNILTNFKSIPRCPAFNRKLKDHGKSYYKAGVKVRVAVLGIDNPLKRLALKATMAITRIRNVKLFENREEALKWLSA